MLQEIPLSDLLLSNTDAQCLRRASFDPVAIDELAESIGRHGVLQPIVVRNREKKLVIVAGERRYLAANIAGLDTIPAIVREMSDEEAIEVQLIENLQRAALHPMEEAESYQQLLRTFSVSMDELHARVGKSKSYVYKRMKLLGLSSMARQMFYQGKINTSCALELAKLESHGDQDEILQEVEEFFAYNGEPTAEDIRRDVEHLMHRQVLDKAPFPIDDADLIAVAGSCLSCPKRTSAQPELFDVDEHDRCTDSLCWRSKAGAHGERVIEQATAEGREIIQGAEAKKACRYGTTFMEHAGFYRTDDKPFIAGKQRKVSSVVGKQLVPAVMISPDGDVLEVYRKKDVDPIVKEKFPDESTPTSSTGETEAERKRKTQQEKAFRLALWAELRTQLPEPSLVDITRHIVDSLDFDSQKFLAEVIGWEPPEAKHSYGGKDWRAIPSVVDGMSPSELHVLINDCLHLQLLAVHTWMDPKTPKELRDLAKEYEIDTRKLRAAVKPKAKKGRPAKKKKDYDPFVHSAMEGE